MEITMEITIMDAVWIIAVVIVAVMIAVAVIADVVDVAITNKIRMAGIKNACLILYNRKLQQIVLNL